MTHDRESRPPHAPSSSSAARGATQATARSTPIAIPRPARCWPKSPKPASADLDAAVASARKAFDAGKWSTMAASRRAKIVYKMAQLIAERGSELTLLEVRDNGKAISTAKGELGAIVDCFEFYAGAATKNYGESMPPPLPTYLANTVREPVGVVGAIVPWNFPLLLAAWKVAPALAAGCTVVLKPAPSTPLTTLELGRIALEAGVPEGVLNVVTGSGRELGAWLVEHPGVDKIAFTGSTATGKIVAPRRRRRSNA